MSTSSVGPIAAEAAPVPYPLLEEVFGGATRRFRAQMASRTGSESQVQVGPIVLSTLEGLCVEEAYADAGLWCSFQIVGVPTPAYIVIEGSLLARLMGRLFGEGDVETLHARPRGITEVECMIGGRLCRDLMDAVAASWAGAEALVVRPGAVAPSQRVCAEVDPATPYAITTLEMGGNLGPGNIFVALPAAVWEVFGPRRRSVPSTPARREPAFDRVMPVQIELVVEIARLDLSLRRLQALTVGDELPLGALGEACGRVGDKRAFYGEPGASGGVRSFRVMRRADSSSSLKGSDR